MADVVFGEVVMERARRKVNCDDEDKIEEKLKWGRNPVRLGRRPGTSFLTQAVMRPAAPVDLRG